MRRTKPLPVTILTPPWWDEFLEKLRKLAELPKGWDSYGADPVTPSCIQKAIEALPKIVVENTPMPSVVPCSDSGVQIEWHTRDMDVEIGFTLDGRVKAFVSNLKTSEEWDADVTGDILRLRRALFPLAQWPTAEE